VDLLYILLIFLLFCALGGAPGWGWGWGWGPSGFLGFLFVVLLVYLLLGRGPRRTL
jgi:hypothetical protein